MASDKGTWDFECPQFIDFVSGLDHSRTEDVFFDSTGLETPGVGKTKRHTATGKPIKGSFLTEDAENELLHKMDAALSIIECTPKFPVKKHFSEKASNHPRSQVAKTSLKWKTVEEPSGGLLRSRSVIALNKIIPEKENKTKGVRKRSSSLNDLKTYIRKTHPRTPMCLKRTIFKAKAKIQSTEEKELEEIARLQKQLIQHLRYNEMSLRKLGLKPKEHALTQKNSQDKTEKTKENQAGGRDLNAFTEKCFPQREARRIIQKMNHDAVQKEALKLNDIVSNKIPPSKVLEKSTKENLASKPKTTTSISVSETSEKEKPVLKKANAITKKYGFHSGILFRDKVKKNTVVIPFSFETRKKEIKSQSTVPDQEAEAWISSSKLHLRIDDGKENIPYNKVHSGMCVEKTKGVTNVKRDMMKQNETNKIIGNKIRGLPLSENIIRN